MKVIDIVQAAKAQDEAAFAKVADNKAAAIVGAVLRTLSKQIAEAEEPVALAGFGRFAVLKKEVEKDGKKVAVRRVLFKPAQPKAQKSETEK